VLAAVVAVLLVAALANGLRNHNSGPTAANRSPTTRPSLGLPGPGPAPTTGPSPSGPGGNQGGGLGIPAVACPNIRDEQSHLSYSCIDNYLTQSDPDPYLGIRISLQHEVDTGWVISEGSGNPLSLASPAPSVIAFRNAPGSASARSVPAAAPTGDQVAAEVQRRVSLAMREAYGTNPTPKTMAARIRSFAGVKGYEIVTEITLDTTFRTTQKLKEKTERLWTVGLPTPAGVSIFMLSIPDSRADLWPKAEATVGTLRVS
jgi:hypothetical protein